MHSIRNCILVKSILKREREARGGILLKYGTEAAGKSSCLPILQVNKNISRSE
jgi:hypothetical protein